MYSALSLTLTGIFVAGCFHMLQSVETCTSLQNLFEKHLQPVLQEFQVSADSWSLCSPERFIFEALLIYAGTHIKLSAFMKSGSLSCLQMLQFHNGKQTAVGPVLFKL